MLRRTLFAGGLALAVVAVSVAVDLAVLLSPQQVDARARDLLDRFIRTPYRLESVRFQGGDLVVRGLTVTDAEGRLVIRAPEIVLDIDWQRPALGTVRVLRPSIHARRFKDGTWNLETVLRPRREPTPWEEISLPDLRVEVQEARVTLRDDRLLSLGQVLTLGNLGLTLRLGGDRVAGRAELHEPWFERGRVDWEVDLAAPALEVEVGVEKIVVDARTRALLPRSGQRLFDKLRPHGVADLGLRIHRNAGEDARVEGTVRVHNGGIRLEMFPYAVSDATGVIEITDQLVRLRDLHTRSGGEFWGEGEIYLGGPGRDDRIDIRVRVKDVPIDERFAQALPRQAQRILRRFDPRGRASGTVRVYGDTKPQGVEDDVSLDIVARPHGLEARFDEVPVPVHGLEGRVEVHGDFGARRPGRPFRNDTQIFVVDSLRGRVGGGTVAVRGAVGEERIRLQIEAKDLVVQDELIDQLGARGRAIRALRPRGKADVRIAVFDVPPGDARTRGEGSGPRPRASGLGDLEVGFTVAATPHPGLTAEPDFFPYPVTVEGGVVHIQDEAATLDELAARARGGGRVRVSGWVRPQPDGVAPAEDDLGVDLDVRVEAERVPVDRALLRAVQSSGGAAMSSPSPPAPQPAAPETGGAKPGAPDAPVEPALQRIATLLGVREGGTIDRLDLHLRTPPRSAGVRPRVARPTNGLDVHGAARFHGAFLVPRPIRYPLRQLRGVVRFDRREVILTGVQGLLLSSGWPAHAGLIEADGRLALVSDALAAGRGASEGPAAVHLRIHGLRLDRTLSDALPGKLGEAIDALGSRGDLDGHGFALYVPGQGQEALAWNAEARLRLPAIELGLSFDDVRVLGRLHGVLPLGDGQAPKRYAEGRIEVERAQWKKQPLRLTARLDAGLRSFRLHDVSGEFLRGRFSGEEVFYRYDRTRFGGRFALRGGRVEAWRGLKKKWTGALAGHVVFDGVPGATDPTQRLRGEGQLEIRRGHLFAVPDPAEEVTVGFRLDGDRIVLGDPLSIKSKAISLTGRGVLGLGGQADIRIVHEFGADLAQGIPVIDELLSAWRWIWRNTVGFVLSFRITGPIWDPVVIPVPLSLDQIPKLAGGGKGRHPPKKRPKTPRGRKRKDRRPGL